MVVPMVAHTGSAENPFKSQRLAHRWLDIVARPPLPVQLLHILDELLPEIPSFCEDCRDLHLAAEVHQVPKSYGRGRDRNSRYQKVTEGGEIS